MNLLTLITILEPTLTRNTISTKNKGNAISYTGTINTLTINEDTYTNPTQIIITDDTTNTITVKINHLTRTHTTDYPLADITTLEIT